MLYVTVRNFGVLWLASEGKYLFSYESILDALCDARVFHADAVSALGKLRFLKSLYRSGEIASTGIVLAKVRAALSGLPSAYFPSALRLMAADDVLAGPAPSGDPSAYLVLRDLEKRVLAARSIVGDRFDDDALDALSRWIRDPRVYANLSAAMAPQLRAILASYACGNRVASFAS